jgi:hypothetical protein
MIVTNPSHTGIQDFHRHYRSESAARWMLGIWRVAIRGIVVGIVRVDGVRRHDDWRRHEYSPKKEATIVKCAAWEESAMRKEAGVGKEATMRAKAHGRSAAKLLRRRGASEQNAQEADNAEHSRHRYQHRKGGPDR